MNPRVEAAARALCRTSAIECNVNEETLWTDHKRMFVEDAKTAIAAADAAQAVAVDSRLKRLEAIVRSYRDQRRRAAA